MLARSASHGVGKKYPARSQQLPGDGGLLESALHQCDSLDVCLAECSSRHVNSRSPPVLGTLSGQIRAPAVMGSPRTCRFGAGTKIRSQLGSRGGGSPIVGAFAGGWRTSRRWRHARDRTCRRRQSGWPKLSPEQMRQPSPECRSSRERASTGWARGSARVRTDLLRFRPYCVSS